MRRKITSTHPMIKVGITGGIGSGKTTVCKLFEELGIPVYYADNRAKYLMQHELHLIDELKKHFGPDIYENGQLNRAALAAKVFNNAAQLKLLNSLVHPAVFHDTEVWLQQQQDLHLPYVLKEAALLVESGAYKKLDKLIVVTAPHELRVQRVMQRDQVSEAEVMARISNQLPQHEKVKLAHFVIENNGPLHELKEKVLKIHEQLLAVAAGTNA